MAIANGNDSARSKHLDALAAKRYVLEEILDVSEAVAAELNNLNGIEYIVGTQTASTGAWTGVTKDTALYAGKVIIYKLPYAGSGNATLNLTFPNGTKSGAKNIYRYSSTRLTTQYAANYYIPLVFNGTYWFAFADYDTNYYDRIRFSNAIATASGAVQAVCFVGTSDGVNFKQLSDGATFNINYPVYYNSSAVADGAAMSTGLYFALGSINLQTIVGDTNKTFDEKANLYLKGTLSGNIFTVHSDIITTTEPTAADNFVYMRVGRTYSTYQAYVAVFCNELFAYKDGAFKKFDPFAESYSLPTASASTKGGVKVGNGLTMSGDTLNVSIGGAVLSSTPATVDGGLWFETTSTAPIIKFKQGGSTYYLYTNQLVSPNLTLSSSTATVTTGTNQTITLTYSGNGSITLSNPNTSALTASYNSSTKKITLTSKVAAGSSATVSLGIALSESGNYSADSQTLTVTCQGVPVSPNLTITPSSATITSGNATATVSYAGNGSITLTDNSEYVTPTYDSSTKIITVPYSQNEAAYYGYVTVTAALSASTGYTAASADFIVFMGVHSGDDVPDEPDVPDDDEEFGIEINGEPINLEDHSAEVTITEPVVQLYIEDGSDAEVVITDENSNEIVFEQDGDTFTFPMETATATVQISKDGFSTATIYVILG